MEKAVEAIERVRRDELSHVTQPFDAADAFRGEMDVPEAELEYLDAVGDYIVESMPGGLSAYDQYKYLGFVLSFCAEYDYDVHEDTLNETPYGALIEGRAICLGYTNTMLWLCEKAGLRCSAISGYASWNGEGARLGHGLPRGGQLLHGYNLVRPARRAGLGRLEQLLHGDGGRALRGPRHLDRRAGHGDGGLQVNRIL